MAGGKYDFECEALLVGLGAQGLLLIVLDGDRGTGFSVSCRDAELARKVPGLLRGIAADIEAQNAEGAN